MGPLQLANHLLGLLAPALFVAAVLAIAGPWVSRGSRPARRPRAFLVNFLVGAMVLAAGLWVFGRDGKMATYAALVVVVGSTQWLMGGGWRSSR